MSLKKGLAASMSLSVVMGLLIGAVITYLILSIATGTMTSLWASTDCVNNPDWQKLYPMLEKMDNNEAAGNEILFYNGYAEDCKLVAFSKERRDVENIEYLYKGRLVPQDETALCLCEMDNLVCNAVSCYQFKNVKEILEPTYTQFSTVGWNSYVTIGIKKEGDVLVMDLPEQDLRVKTLIYTSNPELESLDQGIINSLELDFDLLNGNIQGFMPIVEIQPGPIYPTAIPRAGVFPTMFNVDIRSTQGTADYSISDFKLKAQKVKLDLINGAYFTLIIPAAEASSVNTNEFSFYYNQENWQKVPLHCEGVGDLTCTAEIEGFAKEFAISI